MIRSKCFATERVVEFISILLGDFCVLLLLLFVCLFWTSSPVSWAYYRVVRSFPALHCDVTKMSVWHHGQNTKLKQQLNGNKRWKMRWRANPLSFFLFLKSDFRTLTAIAFRIFFPFRLRTGVGSSLVPPRRPGRLSESAENTACVTLPENRYFTINLTASVRLSVRFTEFKVYLLTRVKRLFSTSSVWSFLNRTFSGFSQNENAAENRSKKHTFLVKQSESVQRPWPHQSVLAHAPMVLCLLQP